MGQEMDTTADRHRPLIDIGIVVIASVIAFAAESAAADYLPWGDEARGVTAVLLGTAPPISSLTQPQLESMIANAGFEIVDSKVYNPKSRQRCVLARKR